MVSFKDMRNLQISHYDHVFQVVQNGEVLSRSLSSLKSLFLMDILMIGPRLTLQPRFLQSIFLAARGQIANSEQPNLETIIVIGSSVWHNCFAKGHPG
jgi:hypothetical protein